MVTMFAIIPPTQTLVNRRPFQQKYKYEGQLTDISATVTSI